MNGNTRIVLLSGVLALAGCQQQAQRPQEWGDASDGAGVSTTRVSPPLPAEQPVDPAASNSRSEDDPANVENDGRPDLTPAPLTGDATRSEEGARTILLSWERGIELRGIELREFDQAWDLMGRGAKNQLSKAQLNAMFQPLRDISVVVPDGRIEGAAGSSYYRVPVTVTGARADGGTKSYEGEIVLRRVNDIPGATPEQLTWHIERVELKPT